MNAPSLLNKIGKSSIIIRVRFSNTFILSSTLLVFCYLGNKKTKKIRHMAFISYHHVINPKVHEPFIEDIELQFVDPLLLVAPQYPPLHRRMFLCILSSTTE